MDITCLQSGSTSEGVALKKTLGSDIDIMYVMRGASVIEGHEVAPGELDHLYQIVEASHPAHVYLHLLSPGARKDDIEKRIVRVHTPDFCELFPGKGNLLNGEQLKHSLETSSHR